MLQPLGLEAGWGLIEGSRIEEAALSRLMFAVEERQWPQEAPGAKSKA